MDTLQSIPEELAKALNASPIVDFFTEPARYINERGLRLMREALDDFEANPGKHYQGDWYRRSSGRCCLVGNMALKAGATFVPNPEYDTATSLFMVIPPAGGEPVFVSDFIREIAGMGRSDLAALSYSGNSLEDLEHMYANLARGERPALTYASPACPCGCQGPADRG